MTATVGPKDFRVTRKHTFIFLGVKHIQSEGVAEVCHVILEKEQSGDQIPGEFIISTAEGIEIWEKGTNGRKQVMLPKKINYIPLTNM